MSMPRRFCRVIKENQKKGVSCYPYWSLMLQLRHNYPTETLQGNLTLCNYVTKCNYTSHQRSPTLLRGVQHHQIIRTISRYFFVVVFETITIIASKCQDKDSQTSPQQIPGARSLKLLECTEKEEKLEGQKCLLT